MRPCRIFCRIGALEQFVDETLQKVVADALQWNETEFDVSRKREEAWISVGAKLVDGRLNCPPQYHFRLRWVKDVLTKWVKHKYTIAGDPPTKATLGVTFSALWRPVNNYIKSKCTCLALP